MGQNEPDDTEPASVVNEMSGTVTGPAVQTGSVDSINFYNTACAHNDLTPKFDIWCTSNGDNETMSVSFTLTGPATLDQLDEVAVSVKDAFRLPPATSVDGTPEDETQNVVWGAWSFRPCVDFADRDGRTATLPYPVEMGDRTRLFVERSFPPARTLFDLQSWRSQFADSPLRLLFTCRRDGEVWRIPVEVAVPVAAGGQ